jgi:5-methylcytosine-specific restriction protein A
MAAFQDDGTFIFTGAGQEGDMRWSAMNVAVRDHKNQRKKLLLYTNTAEIGFVEFVGEMDFKSYHNAVRLDSTHCKPFAN